MDQDQDHDHDQDQGCTDVELERDFVIACNMLLGQDYETAQQTARQWMLEARE